MQNSVATSPLLAHRAEHVVPERLSKIETAYLAKDFATFGDLTMADSNQFHATCLDSYPPIFYLNDVSRDVIRVVHAYNEQKGGECPSNPHRNVITRDISERMRVVAEVVAAYTFDAGPNAVIYTTEAQVPELLATLMTLFPPPAERAPEFTNAPEILDAALATAGNAAALPALEVCADSSPNLPREDAVTMVLHTRVGGGPVRLTGEYASSLRPRFVLLPGVCLTECACADRERHGVAAGHGNRAAEERGGRQGYCIWRGG